MIALGLARISSARQEGSFRDLPVEAGGVYPVLANTYSAGLSKALTAATSRPTSPT